MTSDYRITPGLVHEILDALERHGYYRSDDQHADRAIGLIGDMARVYEGTQDYPTGACLVTVPSSRPANPEPSGQAAPDGVVLTDRDVRTVVAALDIAAACKRDGAERCADCPGQSCLACQTRLRDAQAYDGMADRLVWAAEPARAAQASPLEPDSRPQPAAGREAGQ
jgi:hypothetical protein